MTQPTADLFESLVDQSIAVATASGNENWRVTSVSRDKYVKSTSDVN